MTSREKAFGIAALALLVAAAFIAYQWLGEYEARLNATGKSTIMENTINVNAQAIDQAKRDFAEATADQKRTLATLQQQLSFIQTQRTAVPSPQQFVVDASKLIPNLPAPLKVQEVPATATTPATQEVVIPKQDLAAFHNYKLDCDEKGARLTACEQNSSDDGAKILSLSTELTKTQDDFQLMSKDRNNWERVAKGGTVWHKTLSAAKWVVVGGAIGYAASKAAH